MEKFGANRSRPRDLRVPPWSSSWMASVWPAASGRESVDARIARLASRQHGVFSRADATLLGATRGQIEHRVSVGRWERCSRDVFVVAGAPETWHRAMLAACLGWGARAVASHRAAAVLWRLPGPQPAAIELSVPSRWVRPVDAIVHRRILAEAEITIVDAIPVTRVARTLLDLGAVVSAEMVEEALDDALRRRIVTIPLLRRLLQGDHRGRRGAGVLRALVEQRASPDPRLDSVLETRVLRLIRRAKLPEPRRQYRVRGSTGVVARVDFAYPRARLAIEADGYRWHSGHARWRRDRARLNALTALGWRVIHVTWADLQGPRPLLEAIGAALGAR